MSALSIPISVLIIEDSASDAGLLIRQLQKAGFEVTHERVDSADEMSAALNMRVWDLVLSDFNVPGFGAAAALALLQQAGLDIPFIVVSGVIDEASAVELMRNGAHDYLMKSNLARLAPAVKRELAEARQRLQHWQLEEALKMSEDRYRDLVEHSQDLICTHDLDGRILSMNLAPEKILGYKRDEMLKMNLRNVFAPSLRKEFDEYVATIQRDGVASGLMFVHARSGEKRVWEYHNTLRTDGVSAPIVRGMARDITESRRAAAESVRHAEELERARTALLGVLEDQHQAQARLGESERRFRLLIEKSLAGMYVSRNGSFVYANPRLEQILGFGPGEMIGINADAFVLPEDLPVMNAARDELRAGASSAAYSVRARRPDGGIVELGIQGVVTDFDGEPAIVGMAQDIGERNRAQAEIKQYIARLEQTTRGTLEAVAMMVEQRDPYTAGHERRVGELAAAIGAEMDLPDDTVKGLRLTGYVHDVGKISVPAELLSKPARLAPMEFELIKGHSQCGYDVLKNVDFPWPVAEVILQHHERLDGSGYPRQLKGEQIILEARIMSVADVVEAMSSHRPYRPGLGMEAALGEIEKNSGKLYDAKVVEACLRLFREKAYTLPA